MTDGVELNAGTGGATAATDDCGAAGHAQIVKLAISTDGSATPIPAEATNGLDVDVTRVIPGTSATHLGKGEDVAHASGDVGVLLLAVRRDTAAVGSDTDGDNSTVNVDGSGRVWVNGSGVTQPVSDAGASLTVDNAALSVVGGGAEATALRVTLASDSTGVLSVDDNGTTLSVDDGGASLTIDGTVAVSSITTAVVPGTAATNLGKAEDDPHASGDVGVLLLAVRRDTAAVGSGTDGDNSTLNVNNAGRLYTSSTIDAALPAGTNAIGKLAANSGVDIGDVDVTSSALPTGASTSAKQDTIITALQLIDDPVAVLGTATYTEATTSGMVVGAVRRDADTTLVNTTNEIGPLQMDANGRLKVEAFSGETLPVSLAALPASTNTLEVVGDVAHDAGAAGNPVQIGGYATNSIEGLTQVAAGDLTRTVHDLNGVQVVRPHTTLEECISERVSNTDGASTAFTNFAAGGAGVHNYITQVTIWNSSATDGFVDFRDGTAGSVKWTFPAPQTGGCTVSFDPPLKFGDNTAVAFDVSGAISTVYISANGFQAQG